MVILLNCSFRGEKSNTRYFLGQLEKLINEPCRQVSLNRIKDKKELAKLMKDADAVVFGMPLYVDGAPAQTVELMEWLYREEKDSLGKLPVYVVANMGFYESSQLCVLLSIIKNWCVKMGAVYGGGLAVGAGEMMGRMGNIPLDQGPNKILGEGLKKLAAHIGQRTKTADIHTEPAGFPKRMYLVAAGMTWGRQAKENGVKRKELKRRR